MTDRRSRRDRDRESLRVPRARPHRSSRNSSVRSSARSSANYEEPRHRHPSTGPTSYPAAVPAPYPTNSPYSYPSAANSSRSLRAASSRFSLNEQFAATRQDFNLWDDDASSIYDQGINEDDEEDDDEDEEDEDKDGDKDEDEDEEDSDDDDSDDEDSEDDEKAALSSTEGNDDTLHEISNAPPVLQASDSNFYDLFCLPQGTQELSQQQIRNAYYRLFVLFYPDSYPARLRPIARQQFLRVQNAFETLIDPVRRAQYDVDQFVQAEETGSVKSEYETAFDEAVRDRIQGSISTNSDLGVRLDASESTSGRPKLQILDFALSHSVTIELPGMQKLVQPQIARIESFTSKNEKEAAESLSQPGVQVATPTVTITGSTYGISKDLSSVPTSLLLMQLVENKFAPLATLQYRQEFINRKLSPSPEKFRWIKTAVELEADVLPELTARSRLYHHFLLPKFTEPTIAEASIQSSRDSTEFQPRVALGLYQNLRHGTGFLRADSGDWAFGTEQYSRFFSEHSTINPAFFNAEAPGATPSIELGFRTGQSDRLPAPGSSDTPGDEGGIRGLDYEINTCQHGTWAISASASPVSAAGAIRYSKDLVLPFQAPPTSLDPGMPAAARLEAELCSNRFQDQYLAVRNLWSVGRFTRIGIEIGMSIHNLHLSVYWSRLGQRLSVPLLIAPRSLLGPDILFWAGALPFAGLAAVQLGLSYRRQQTARSHRRSRLDIASTDKPVAIAQHRFEADNITTLLAQPVEVRQKGQMTLKGLVILSARFGVPSEDGSLVPGDEVADVTIAVAALISEPSYANGPALVIHQGVRKSRLPGFWDPAPGQDKVLRVEYQFKGEAGSIEVSNRDELVLPPQA
ncbi:unnamed protein product [Fusarium graminearum]|uniref:J domain-containing protein n=1 Tax=Gibberella zeae (strain ATCC MYA-4620 / CBS 123657 / FGSC 9075 / NRRL 31084 / PH-1) TaxID=229533 RepID=I1RBL3_GIBZE|nr:hypothetical protein FGSG_00939 [Fusarium graminearum PH-1]ESU06195.1 hypothetical protein FGSG_00939 [Fusarium graminearum PH-1]CZS76251.1 unnamed protein product [Fusarium graminearum]|eukprot:XP_011316680.1 hypothetical protein FGSG_00939 [Fusarium graminearum PH-1]